MYDGRSAFSEAFSFLKSVFTWVFTTLDKIYLLGNFSMLDFFIALIIVGAILPIVIKSVSNYSSTAISHHDSKVKKERSSDD